MSRGIVLLFSRTLGTRLGSGSALCPGRLYPREKPGYPLYRRPVWTGGKFRPHRDSIPDRPTRSSVAIPTELPGPHVTKSKIQTLNEFVPYFLRVLQAYGTILPKRYSL